MRAHEFITENISGNYLYHATSADGLKGILQSGAIELVLIDLKKLIYTMKNN